MKYIEVFPTITCPSDKPWITYYDGFSVNINETLKRLHFQNMELQCWFRSLKYHKELGYVPGLRTGPFSSSLTVNGRPDFVEVECYNSSRNLISKAHHYIVRNTAGQRNEQGEMKLHYKTKKRQMNVLMVGMDSVSSHMFKRAMPKTRKFLVSNLGAFEMKMHTVVGDATIPNRIAMLTGKSRTEIPNWDKGINYNTVSFIWEKFKSNGYRTQYASDRFDFDNFKQPPTDSYNLPMAYALMPKMDALAFNNECFGDQVEVNLWLNFIKEFILDARSKSEHFFSFSMFSRPTHDNANKATSVDEHYENFLKGVFEQSGLEDTFLIFFGDHGARSTEYRKTFDGSIEERAPNMVIYIPPRFRNAHINLYNNLVTNMNRLTTNFDIYQTLQDIADSRFQEKINVSKVSRGISLFSEIPASRQCEDAGILVHHCLCYGGISIADVTTMRRVGRVVVVDINSLTKQRRDSCDIMKLKTVDNLILLKGRVGGKQGFYRVMITTEPGDAKFEATVSYSARHFPFRRITLRTEGLISRINVYRGQSDCVQHNDQLRMYCHCKDR
ncbi:uncharacterized protein LOC101860834 [Aplysia californica]|uniref:Uncharacterized protein LOC101860834 n=1 Tax=Aplysia californica TaxID=6500 RepID=A0ABM0JXN8_APLCA|nr:uncharacterized protein LOC101860834 [Aplysia californica]